jgi:integral membrane protein (TIGR00529 family)
VLAGILLLLWRRWNLGTVLLLASTAIGLLFGLTPAGLLQAGIDTIRDPITLRLVAVVTLILSLGAILKATAKLDGLVRSLERLLPDGRVTMAAIPALIGLLPMVGGAIFSAPMVDEVGNHLQVDEERKTFVNYWFRHVWEWILPTYPSLILAAALLDIAPRALTLSHILVGLLPIRRVARPRANPRERNGNLRLLVVSIWPIVLVIILSVALHVDLILSLLATIGLLVLAHRLGPARVWQVLRHGVSLRPVLLIIAVMLFRQVLESTGAVSSIPTALTAAGVPTPLILFFIPMLAGLLTGLAVGAFGVSFPVIMPLLVAGGLNMGAVALAYTGGFLGVMLSPLHLCFSLTRDYYQAEWGPNYRMLLPSILAVAAVAAALYVLW